MATMPGDTLADALEALDAVIGETSCPPGGDLRALAQDVAGDVALLARARGIEVAMGIRSRDVLSGRDRRRWRYLLEQATTLVVDALPAGSRLRVELGCVATTSGHRWLQADLAVTSGDEDEGPVPGSAGGRDGFRSIVVETGLRLLDGALDRTTTADGRVLRLVAPIER